MERLQLFLDFINKKTCNQFNFLRLKQVFFDKEQNTCVVSFIYPNNVIMNEQDKQRVECAVKEYIQIDGKVDVRISKSFVEKDLIVGQIKKYLQKTSPAIFSNFNFENINVDIAGSVKISFELESPLYNYFISSNLDKKLIDFLQKNFYASFEIDLKQCSASQIQNNMLQNRVQQIQIKNDLDALIKNSEDKYMVENKKVVIGQDITFNPRYISSINKEYESCVIAGKINYITEKKFLSKRVKKNKDGTEERIEKPYFNFQIKDSSGKINGVIFPSTANYHKMNLIKNGDMLLLQGKISKFNDSFEIVAKNISSCSLVDKSKVENIVNQDLINDYKYVKPQKYYSQKQANIFDASSNYSPDAMRGSYVVYDFETTGTDVSKDMIIEIGALKIVNGEYKEIFTTLVNPKIPIPPEASKVNKITNEMVANCYSIEQVIRDFYLFCKGSQMVGYNSISFDSAFLTRAGKSVGIVFENNQLDAFLLAKQKLRGLKNYKLGTVAKYLDVNLIDAHRALNDVIATAEVFLKLY